MKHNFLKWSIGEGISFLELTVFGLFLLVFSSEYEHIDGKTALALLPILLVMLFIISIFRKKYPSFLERNKTLPTPPSPADSHKK